MSSGPCGFDTEACPRLKSGGSCEGCEDAPKKDECVHGLRFGSQCPSCERNAMWHRFGMLAEGEWP